MANLNFNGLGNLAHSLLYLSSLGTLLSLIKKNTKNTKDHIIKGTLINIFSLQCGVSLTKVCSDIINVTNGKNYPILFFVFNIKKNTM